MVDFLSGFLGRERFKGPGARIGIGGYSAFARVRERIALKATVPTSYVEDGSPTNDHIIREAEVVSIEGVIGDVYRGPTTNILETLPVVSTLGNIDAYLPRVSSFQETVMSALRNTTNAAMRRINDLLGAGNQVNGILGNLDTSSKPLGEQFVDAMENLYYGGQLCSIDMPYRRYDNMVLTAVNIDRDNGGNAMSFSIEAQRFRIAQTTFASITRADKNPAPSSGGQTKDMKDIGTQSGKKTTGSQNTSMLGWLFK